MARTRWQSRWRAARTGDAGSASVELVLVVPALLLMLLVIVQFAVWSHASHIAQAAASHGLAATRVDGGTPAAGRAATDTLLVQLAEGPLRHPTVTVERGTATARVRVEGSAQAVIPFLVLPVRADASGPIERIGPESLGFRNSEGSSVTNPSMGGT